MTVQNGEVSTHFVEEIHQPSQLRSLETGQIPILLVTPNQAIEVAREFLGRGIERVKVL